MLAADLLSRICRVSFALILMALSLNAAFAQAADENVTSGKPEAGVVRYGIVLDNSGAFRLTLERAVKILADVVRKNAEGDQTFLMTFSDAGNIVVRQELTSNRAEMVDSVENVFAEVGRGSYLDAIKASLEFMAEAEVSDPVLVKSLIIVTDGEERDAAIKPDDLIFKAKAAKVRLCFIVISAAKQASKQVDRLARETGGTAIYPKTAEEFRNASSEIAKEIRRAQIK